ncbi:IS3 family transposase [Enterobacter sp. UPMP2052]
MVGVATACTAGGSARLQAIFSSDVDDYIRWYNEHRIKMSPGAVSPEMYRQQLGIT